LTAELNTIPPAITFFAWPKPFTGDAHIATIQRNAIRSWTLLHPRPQIILLGDEPGVEKTCREFGLMHCSEVARNEFGTALVASVFEKAEQIAAAEVLCYINSDILLFQDYMDGVRLVCGARKRFLIGLRPWDFDVRGEAGEALDHIQETARRHGRLRGNNACDVFVFSKGLWPAIPPLALGRCGFDGALLRLARESGAPLVDATESITAVHQHHSYAEAFRGEGYLWNPEAIRNYATVGGFRALFTWANATHVIKGGRLKRAWRNVARWYPAAMPVVWWWRKVAWFPFLRLTRPVRRHLGLTPRGSGLREGA
jgi:hypothetical protein